MHLCLHSGRVEAPAYCANNPSPPGAVKLKFVNGAFGVLCVSPTGICCWKSELELQPKDSDVPGNMFPLSGVRCHLTHPHIKNKWKIRVGTSAPRF